MKPGHLLAWHFTAERRKLRDGSAFRIGRWTKHKGPLILCKTGLHASVDPFDALAYAPGAYLWRVECGGEVIHSSDDNPPKLVCSERKVIGGGDAAEVLRAFASSCARDVLHLWEAPKAVHVYLESGDETLRAAAWAAACAAARDAAWAAARDAAWAAACAAARDAAWAAARAAAWAAACAAARDAAWASQRARFNEMVEEWFAAEEQP